MPNLLKFKRGLAGTIPTASLAEPLFTTDTYDLYIGNGTGNTRFQKYIASGTTSQYLRGDGSLATHDLDSLTDVVITSASSGQVLKYDGTNWINGTDTDTGITSLNGLTALTQTFAVGTTGTDFGISSLTSTHTFNLPTASATNRGALSSADWTTFNSKEAAITAGTTLQYFRGDKTFQTLNTSVVPESGAIYFTEPRVLATVLTGLNLTGGGTIAATDSVLAAFGKVQNQISALVGGATYQGVWNASTNSPSLASGTGTKGYYYVVSVAGSTNLDGITDWKVGDWAIFNGTTWDKVDNTDAVSSVNGFTGAVNLGLGDISNVALTSPTNAQLLRFNGTSSKWENWTPTYISAAITSLNGLTGATQTFANDTNVIMTSAGTTHTLGWTGNLAVGRGGTGITTYTLGDILYSSATNVLSKLAGNTTTTKKFLNQTGDGTISGAPVWSALVSADIPNNAADTSGNAATATKLATARTLTIGSTGKTFDGSANVSWSLAEIGAQATLTNPVTGTGTTGTLPKFSGASTLNDSVIIQSGSDILIGATADQGKLQIDGTTSGGIMLNCSNTQFGFTIKNTSSSNKKWDLSPSGNDLYLNESGATAVMQFKAGGGDNIRLYTYTSNGFLKTSGGSGTLTVDTTSYLPLGGGTLTGNLDVRASNLYVGSTKGYIYFTEDQINAYYSTDADATLNINYYGYNQGLTRFRNFNVYNGKGSSIFYLAGSTGAATFSSSVTVNGDLKISNALIGGDVNYNIGINYNTGGTPEFNYYGGTTSSKFKVTSTGAATFSSSVTATTGLTIGSLASGSNAILSFATNASGSPRSITYRAATADITIDNTAGSALMTITNGGNVGIGESNPSSYKLQVKGADGSGIQYEDTNAVKTFLGSYLSKGILGTLSNHDVGIWTNNSVKMTITSGGNVGIGTSSPSDKLEVNGAIFTTANTVLETTKGAIFDFNDVQDAGRVLAYKSTGSNLLFYTNANGGGLTERMRISSGGNVGIGYDAPGYKLYVKESATNYASVFENTLSTGYGIQVLVNNSGTTYKYFSGYSTSAAAERIIIYSNGNIVNANGSYGTISDITLKENIIDATPKLQDLLKLKVRNFNFIGDETKQIGFIAQEFEQVFPSMIDYDDSSNLKSIKTSVLVPILVKAIQELKQELDILKNKN